MRWWFCPFRPPKKTQGRQTIFRQGPCWNRWLLAEPRWVFVYVPSLIYTFWCIHSMYRSRDLCTEIPPKSHKKGISKKMFDLSSPTKEKMFIRFNKKTPLYFYHLPFPSSVLPYQRLPFPLAAPPAGSGHWFVPDVPHVPPQGQRPRRGEEAWRVISNATLPPQEIAGLIKGLWSPPLSLLGLIRAGYFLGETWQLVSFFLDSHENGTLTFSLRKKTAPKLNDGKKKHMHAIIIYNWLIAAFLI